LYTGFSLGVARASKSLLLKQKREREREEKEGKREGGKELKK